MTQNALAFLLGLGLSGCILILAAVIGTPDAPDESLDPADSAGDFGLLASHEAYLRHPDAWHDMAVVAKGKAE